MVGDDRPRAPSDVPPADDDPFGGLNPGASVGKYEVVATLGQGAFGITYRARDPQLGRDVALKEYLPTSFAVRRGGSTVLPRSTDTANDFVWGRERFLDEARTLARLEDAPGIVNVYDYLEANGTAYMVMALARGETLQARLKREQRLPQTAIEQLLYPLLDGLEKVHAANFLHRDIKPGNILVDGDGRPTLIDFGASRLALSDRTQAMTAVYTPGYAAFEQMTSGRQGPWTDIYALAGTLYHCIAGAPPPPALERTEEDTLAPAAEIGKGRYAPSLLAAIDAGLKLRAADRPQSIADWRRSFWGMGTVPGGTAMPSAAAQATRLMPEAAAPRRRAALPLLAAGLVAVCVAAGGTFLVLRPSAEEVRMTLKRTEDKAAAEAAARREAEEAERQRIAAGEARRKADAEKAAAEAATRRKAEADAKTRADAEARRRREDQIRRETEERVRAEYEARAKADAEAAREKADTEARRKAEDKARADAEAKRQAEAAEAALRLSPDDRRRVHVALTALGYDTRGAGASFGPRSREMIAAWQKSQNALESGYLTAPQFAALRQQAAPALARYDEEQKANEETRRKAAEEKARTEEKARAEERARTEAKARADAGSGRAPAMPQASDPDTRSAQPADSRDRFDGRWQGTYVCAATKTKQAFDYAVSATVRDGVLTWRLGRANEPGSQTASGQVSADDTIAISVEGIDSGRPGGGERGARYSSQYRGRFDGNELVAESVTARPRRCVLTLKRS